MIPCSFLFKACAVGILFTPPAHAPVITTAEHHLSATEITCNAFAGYQAHPSKGRLETVLRDSLNLPGYGKPGLVSDIAQLWSDSAGGYRQGLASDVEWVRDDCGGAN